MKPALARSLRLATVGLALVTPAMAQGPAEAPGAPAPDEAPPPLPPPPPPPEWPPAPPPSGPAAPGAAAAKPGAEAPSLPRAPQGFSVGVRIGYSIPIGNAYSAALSNLVTGVTPVWLDAGYRISPHLYVGGEFVYAPAIIPPASFSCPDLPSASCSGHQYRFGADAIYHFLPDAKFDPWAGLGVGYEILDLSATDTDTGGVIESASLHGLTFFHVQGGGDLHVTRVFDFGPFVDLAVGEYAAQDIIDTTGNVIGSTSTNVHAWLTLGARVTLNP